MASVGERTPITIEKSLFARVLEDFKKYRDTTVDREAQSWNLCSVRTILGTLHIDLETLLLWCAKTVEHLGEGETVQISAKSVRFATRIFERLPQYIERDLAGLMTEFVVGQNPVIKPEAIWEEQFAEVHDRKAGTVNLYWLRVLLMGLGAKSLEIDDVRSLVEDLYSRDGLYGKHKWKLLIDKNIKPIRKAGRPRNKEYDQIYEKRRSNPEKETYGKLIRELSDFKKVRTEILRNRAKASAAYRKKSQST